MLIALMTRMIYCVYSATRLSYFNMHTQDVGTPNKREVINWLYAARHAAQQIAKDRTKTRDTLSSMLNHHYFISIEAAEKLMDAFEDITAIAKKNIKEDGKISEKGREIAIEWLLNPPYNNTGEIMMFLPYAYKDDDDLCRRMLLLYHTTRLQYRVG